MVPQRCLLAHFEAIDSILAVANLLAHNNKSQICYCGQISLQSAAVSSQYDTFGVTIYFAGDGSNIIVWLIVYCEIGNYSAGDSIAGLADSDFFRVLLLCHEVPTVTTVFLHITSLHCPSQCIWHIVYIGNNECNSYAPQLFSMANKSAQLCLPVDTVCPCVSACVCKQYTSIHSTF